MDHEPSMLAHAAGSTGAPRDLDVVFADQYVSGDDPVASPDAGPFAAFKTRIWVPVALAAVDVVALELSLALGCLVRFALADQFPIRLAADTYGSLAIGVALLPIAYFALGLYPGYASGPVDRIRIQTSSTCMLFFAVIIWDGFIADRSLSRGVLVSSFAFALVIPPVLRSVVIALLCRNGIWGKPVAIVGRGAGLVDAVRQLKNNRVIGLVPVAVYSDDESYSGESLFGIPVLRENILTSLSSSEVSTVVIAMPEAGETSYLKLVQALPFKEILLIPRLSGIQSTWVTPRDLKGVLSLELKRNLLIRKNQIIKSILDRVLALLLLVLTAPLMFLAAVSIKLCSPGPVLYRQEREGQSGKVIQVLKFRTMHVDADQRLQDILTSDARRRAEWERYYKLEDDPRIIPAIGSFMRRASLDELPQIWNVLRGDMSLVGPRPFPDYHLDSFSKEFREVRRQLRPGITGLWQVEARSDGDLEVQEVLDTYYIRNWSLWLDIYILFRTVTAVANGAGAR